MRSDSVFATNADRGRPAGRAPSVDGSRVVSEWPCRCGGRRANLPLLRSVDQAQLCPRPTERTAPRACPGQTAGEHRQHQPSDPEACDAVQIFQQWSACERKARPQRSSHAEWPWPPQVEPCQDHHDRPAGGQFHQPVAPVAEHERSVKPCRPRRKTSFRIDRSHHLPLGRDVDVYLPSIGEVKLDHRRIACPFGQAIVVEPAARAGGLRGHQLLGQPIRLRPVPKSWNAFSSHRSICGLNK